MSVPECDGCGARGYYGVCHDCQTRDFDDEITSSSLNDSTRRSSREHEAEPRNHHVTTGHNRWNVLAW